MNMSLGSYTIPVASLNAFTMASTALLIPILDLFVYPMLNRFNKGPTMLQRIGETAFVNLIWVSASGRNYRTPSVIRGTTAFCEFKHCIVYGSICNS